MTVNKKRIQKTKGEAQPFMALLSAAVTLAMATLVGASSSPQVEQLGPLAVSRTAHVATVLSDGRVLITGGRDSSGTLLGAAEIFDPTTQLSAGVASLGTPRVGHTATLLKDGRVLVAGGSDANGPLASAEIFDPASPLTGFRPLTNSMGAARSGHTATLLNSGKVLIAGGDDTGTAEIFDPTGETFSSPLLVLTAPRTHHTATLFSDDSVLLAGGNTDSMEYFSSVSQTFALDAQKMTAARTGHEAISLSDTRLLLFGGDSGNTIDEFNPTADTLTLKGTMDAPASSATLLANGKILVLRPDVAGLYAADAIDAASAFAPFDETSVPGSTALLRSGQTATELSGDKKILVSGGENAQHQPMLQIATFNPARIWTDKDDYMPDEPVFLFGSGWKPNENVYLYAVDSETEQWTYESTVAADTTGSFALEPYFIVQLRQLGTTFDVNAVGAQSALQAAVTFTDAVSLKDVSVGTQSATPIVGAPTSVQYDVTVDFKGNNTTDTANLSLTWGNPGPSPAPTGVSTSFTPPSVTSSGATVHSTLTITTTAATPAGNFPFIVIATDSGGTVTGAGTFIVTGGTVTKLAFTTGPVTVTAGVTSGTITVQRQDAAGNPNFVEGTRSITLSSSSTGTVTFSPTSLTIPSGSSSATFTYTDTKAGTPTITAASNSPSVVTSATQTETVNAAAPSKLVFTTSAITTNAGQASSSITVQRQDSFGNPNTTEGNRSVTLSSNSAGTITFTPASPLTISSGQSTASFTYTDTKAGTPTITAASTGISSATQIETVNTAAINKLAFTTAPVTTNAGVASSTITVQRQDTFGNPITTEAARTVTLSSNSTGTVTFTPASPLTISTGQSAASFTYTDTKAGTPTITAASTSPSLITSATQTETINVGNLHHFAVEAVGGGAIGTQTAGTAFNIMVTARDAGNNTVTSFNGGNNKVMISSTGTLSGGTFTSAAFTNGVLTQSVTITNSGTFTITATGISSNSGITGTSNSFQVIATATTTAVTSSKNPSTYGDSVTFTATVTGSSTPTGSVNFVIDGGSPIAGAAGTTTSTTATWTYTTSALTAATHSVSASFSHSTGSSFQDSSGLLSGGQVVNKAHLTVKADDKSKTYDGNTFTAFTATLSGFVNGDTEATLRTSGALSGNAGFTGAATTAVNASATGYTITPTQGTLSATNYDFTIFNNATLTIDKADATWTTIPNSKTYGDNDPNPLTTGSGSGFAATDNVTATYSRAAGETVAGGPYHITATLSPASVLTNYNITNAGASFTINARPATWTTNPNSKTYGDNDPNPLTTGSGSGFLAADNVTATYSRAAGETVAGGPYHISAVLSPAAVLSNYDITNAGASFTINARPATWTTNPNSKTYGDNDPNPLTSGNGDFLVADNVTATYSRVAGENAGPVTYHITATLAPLGVLSNYSITNAGAEFTINKRPATWTTNDNSKTYGEADPDPVTTGSAVTPGPGTGFLAADGITATYSRVAGEKAGPPTYHITATLAPLAALDNYIITNEGAEFTINRRPATWTTIANSKVYGEGDPNPVTTGSAVPPGPGTGFLAADGVTATYSRATGETVLGGPYHITATLGPADALDNYIVTNNGASFTINTRPATWTTNGNSKTYGDGDPNPLTTGSTVAPGSGTGFLVADGVTATYSRAAGETVLGGPYHISATLAPAGVLSNYAITNMGASFTINTRPATWTTNANSKIYGEGDPNPLTTGSGSNFVAADNVTATYSRATGETVLGGPYQITATLAPASVLSNYSITNAGASFTINTRPATWTTNPNSKTYGSMDPNPLTTGSAVAPASGTGFLVADGVTATYTRAAGETVPGSPYHISATLAPTGVLSNYSITNAGANFTISKAHLTVTAADKTKVFDNTPYSPFTATLSGFVNGETDSGLRSAGALSGAAAFSGDAITAVLPGTYTVTPTIGSLSATNYDFPSIPQGYFVNGKLSITYGNCSGGTPSGVILQPINADGSSVFPKSGRTVPVKFTVCDAFGNPISNPNAVFAGTGGQLTMLSAVRGQLQTVDETAYNDIPDVAFRYTGGQWMFNMATSNLASGNTYTFRVNLAYAPASVVFKITIK